MFKFARNKQTIFEPRKNFQVHVDLINKNFSLLLINDVETRYLF